VAAPFTWPVYGPERLKHDSFDVVVRAGGQEGLRVGSGKAEDAAGSGEVELLEDRAALAVGTLNEELIVVPQRVERQNDRGVAGRVRRLPPRRGTSA
jgi:hypothetical protein